MIRATPREYEKIREALDELDILPLQVLIEATIAEVTLTDELRYGVEWFFRSGDFEFSFTPSATALLPVGGFQGIFDSGNDVRLVLQALDAITDVNVVSSPQLMVLDNQTARIQVGDQVPISVQSATSVIDPDAPVVNSIEYRDTGVILLVTPRVNASGLVIMEIQQEISNVVDAPDHDDRGGDLADHQPAPDQQHGGDPERRDRGAGRADPGSARARPVGHPASCRACRSWARCSGRAPTP